MMTARRPDVHRALRWLWLAVVLGPACSALAADGRDEWQQPDRVLADLSLVPGAQVADVGCGAGYFTFRLAQAVEEEGGVCAVDIDAEVLQKVRERMEQAQLTNIEIVHSEPTDTKLEAASVDAALICDVLHHVPQEQRLPLAQSVVQALKPGGFLFLIDWRKMEGLPFDPYDILIPREELVTLGEEAGLSLDAEFHYLEYQVFLRFRKPPAP